VNTDRNKARRTRTAKLLIAACGAIGCTNGPAISSVSSDPPAALGRSEQRALVAGDTAGRARVTEWPGPASRPIWSSGNRRAAGIPVDPFVSTAAGADRTTMTPGSATRSATQAAAAPRRAMAGATTAPSAGTVHPVSHSAVSPECASPPPGVAVVSDRRLPPAAPLGSRRPAAQAAARISSEGRAGVTEEPADSGAESQDATPVFDRLAAKPVSSSKTIPLDTFLVDGERTRGIGSGRLRNEDMIVDSALLPKRSEVQGGIASTAGDERMNYPITPRRPFGSPMWQSAVTTPTASANLPSSLTPSEPVETEPVSVTTAMPAPAEIPYEAAAGTPVLPAEPAVENPFLVKDYAAAEPIETTPKAQQPALAAGPLFAPGPAFAASAESTAGPTTAVAAAATAPARLAASVPAARPVDLTAANRIEEEGGVRRPLGFGMPLAVGLGLAAVAVVTVTIRRRFA